MIYIYVGDHCAVRQYAIHDSSRVCDDETEYTNNHMELQAVTHNLETCVEVGDVRATP